MKTITMIRFILASKMAVLLAVISIAGAHYVFSQKWLYAITSQEDVKRDLEDQCEGVGKEAHCKEQINAFNANGQTGLMVQARLGRYNDVKELLSYKADPSILSADTQRTTALHLACQGVDYAEGDKLVEALLAAGADVNAKDAHGDTPMHDLLNASSSDKKANVAKSMIDTYKADLNAQNNDGNTPIHAAIIKNDLNWMTFMLDHYYKIIQFDLKNNLGNNPQATAELYGLDQLTTMIKDAIAKKSAATKK